MDTEMKEDQSGNLVNRSSKEINDSTIREYFENNTECNLSNILEIIKIFKTDTASGALIMLGKLSIPEAQPIYVGVKLTFNPSVRHLNNTAEVERQIYSTIINKMNLDGNTPCLPEYYGHYSCDPSEVIINDPSQKNIFDLYVQERKALSDSDNIGRVHLIFTEYIGGISMDKISRLQGITDEEIIIMIFMQLHALFNFSRYMLVHNDIRPGNIMLDISDKPRTFFFNAGVNQVFALSTRVLPKIFDFDRSSIYYPGIQRNIGIDSSFCSVGQCNAVCNRSDLFSLIGSWYIRLRDNPAVKFIVNESGFLPIFEENKKIDNYIVLLKQKMWGKAISNMLSPYDLLNKYINHFLPSLNIIPKEPTYFYYLLTEYRKIAMGNPTNTEGSVPLDVKRFPIRKKIKEPFDGDVKNFAVNLMALKNRLPAQQFMYMWIREGMRFFYEGKPLVNLKIDMVENATTILKATFRAKNITEIDERIFIMYTIASYLLSLYFYPQIPKDVLSYIFSSSTRTVSMDEIISDVWNANNNVLPIQLPLVC